MVIYACGAFKACYMLFDSTSLKASRHFGGDVYSQSLAQFHSAIGCLLAVGSDSVWLCWMAAMWQCLLGCHVSSKPCWSCILLL